LCQQSYRSVDELRLILRTERSAAIKTRAQCTARRSQFTYALECFQNTIARRIQIAADRHIRWAPERIHC
jgi:hypothetical protein